MSTMEIIAIITMVAHYLLPVLAFISKRLPHSFEFAAGSYILTLIGMYVFVCVMPEFTPLRIWLVLSTVICLLIGVFSTAENNSQSSGPGCLLLVPGIIGAIIWCVIAESGF